MNHTRTIIHIGFPKTGTTFLQNYFEKHSDLHHNRDRFKEYHKKGTIDESVICETQHAKIDVLSEELLSIWPGQVDDVSLKMHNLNYNLREHQFQVASDLHRLFPNASILITVRSYPTLISALYSQYLFGGGHKSIRYFLKEEQDKVIELYNYDFVIKTYQELFSKANVIILPFEFLTENPTNYLKYIEDKFQIQHLDFPPNKIHPSLNTFSIPIIRLINFITINYIKLVYKKEKKKKIYLKYLNWLNGFKNKLAKLQLGKKISIQEYQLKSKQFKENSTLILFEKELQHFNSFYKI